jgi:mRNA-degrading endonuclease RelE of RelBE toxin-antitoxin system
MNFEIVATSFFVRELKRLAKRYPAIKNDMAELGKELSQTPTMGTPIGNDCFKIRISITGKNKGKSGGGRVITCVKITKETILLLAIYDKSEQENIADEELEIRLKALDDNA